jgi:Ni/Fe-hydrogenase 1 B-type cytochrome subunit
MSSTAASKVPLAEPVARYRRVYVWEMPVRIYHWLNAACVAVLAVTGFIIGRPVSIGSSAEAYQQYWFGTVRFTHFVAAFVFFFNFMFRIYWGFVGNRYAKWTNFIPTKPAQFKEMLDILRVDVLQTKLKSFISVGHNSLAGLLYFFSFLAFLFQSLTGFAMYSAMSHSFFPRLFTWITPIMGGDFGLRMWHHAFMWFFIAFALIHVYLVFYHDYLEGRGTTSSMVGGWKFERENDRH